MGWRMWKRNTRRRGYHCQGGGTLKYNLCVKTIIKIDFCGFVKVSSSGSGDVTQPCYITAEAAAQQQRGVAI